VFKIVSLIHIVPDQIGIIKNTKSVHPASIDAGVRFVGDGDQRIVPDGSDVGGSE